MSSVCIGYMRIAATRLILSALVIFTLLDLVLTLLWVSSGLASEANPILSAAMDISYILFAILKISLAYFGILILKKYEHVRLTFKAALFAIIIYTILMLWHTYGIYINL